MRREIATDLHRKIGETVSDTVIREIAIAQVVLSSDELAMILIGLAKSMLGTAAGSIASVAPPADRAKMYLEVVDQVAEMARGDLDDALAKIAKGYGEAAA